MAPTLKPKYTIAETAEILGHSPKSVRHMADRGKIKTVQMFTGGRRYVLKSELEELLDKLGPGAREDALKCIAIRDAIAAGEK